VSELGMALLAKSDAAALLTDFKSDAARQPPAPPIPHAQQAGAADVVAQPSILARSPGCTEFASLYDAQSHSSRPQTAAGDADARNASRYESSDGPRAELPAASYTNSSAAPDVAAYGLTPQTPCLDSRERRHEQRRRRHEPEQREELESQEKPGYTIDDIVHFAGVTIAERHTLPADLATTDRP
jgi:hypothetical protein